MFLPRSPWIGSLRPALLASEVCLRKMSYRVNHRAIWLTCKSRLVFLSILQSPGLQSFGCRFTKELANMSRFLDIHTPCGESLTGGNVERQEYTLVAQQGVRASVCRYRRWVACNSSWNCRACLGNVGGERCGEGAAAGVSTQEGLRNKSMLLSSGQASLVSRAAVSAVFRAKNPLE